MEAHYVYRLHADDDRRTVVYVGCTVDPSGRLRHHIRNRRISPHFASATWQRFPDKQSALDHEKALIRKLRPKLNVRSNPGRCPHCGRDFLSLTAHVCALHPSKALPDIPPAELAAILARIDGRRTDVA